MLITTDAAPMNEAASFTTVPVAESRPIRGKCLVDGSIVTPEAVWSAVTAAYAAGGKRIAGAQARARSAWEDGRAAFAWRLREAVESLTIKRAA